MAATVTKQIEAGGTISLLTTELNSIANNSTTNAGPAVNNTAGGTANADGYMRGRIELVLAAYTGTPTAASAIYVWFLTNVDGANYEDGSSSVEPARNPDLVIPVRAVASGPQRIVRRCRLPAGSFKAMAKNAGLGLTLASSGNALKLLADTDEGV